MKKTERVSKLQDRLEIALRVRGITASDLSRKANVPKGAISYYLNGKSAPKADRLNVICSALDVSEAWMLGYDVPMARTAEQKKNDNITRFVARLRKGNDFYDIVSMLAELPDDQYAAAKAMILALSKK